MSKQKTIICLNESVTEAERRLLQQNFKVVFVTYNKLTRTINKNTSAVVVNYNAYPSAIILRIISTTTTTNAKLVVRIDLKANKHFIGCAKSKGATENNFIDIKKPIAETVQKLLK